ncbi:hypothetical protein [Halomonas citrativorans]|uniref:Uncharacterized protein n=1 Tax=Halomonas citrativorans TaxID=2742612 RepID=A0ABR9FFK3_9GAMM|nr:hypothetical protein [Halomonas citrativorans]MBE0405280.1 hypothetical protein [Halomonas citrativorans]
MSVNNNSKPYDTLIHIGCGATPNLNEYRALAKHIWLVDADSQAIVELQEISRTFESVNILHALVDTEKRSGTFYRYSLNWANSLAPIDETIQQLYPGLKQLDSTQQLTTPIGELVTQCLPENSEARDTSLLLLDVGCQNANLLNALESGGVLSHFAMVILMPTHRRAQAITVPYSLHEATSAPEGLTLPEKSQVLERHPLLEQLQRCQADIKQQRGELTQQLEEAHQKTENALHQNHLSDYA